MALLSIAGDEIGQRIALTYNPISSSITSGLEGEQLRCIKIGQFSAMTDDR